MGNPHKIEVLVIDGPQVSIDLLQSQFAGASLRQHRDLAQAMPLILWRAQADGTFDSFNELFFRYSGLNSSDSPTDNWRAACHADDHMNLLKVWFESLSAKTAFEVECRLRNTQGEYRWHSFKVAPEIQDGEIVSWIGSGMDIHERREMTDELLKAKESAESANRAKTNFLANMSHEIRTPLNAIMGFSDLLLNSTNPISSAETQNFLSRIHRNGHLLLKIIDEILDISRIEAGRLKLELSKFNLRTLLMDLRSQMQLEAKNKRLGFSFEFHGMVPELVVTDATRLQQILINLIGNAIKFTDQGSVTVSISVEQQKFRAEIRDTGVGIAPSEKGELFKPFSQADVSNTRRFGGTGLGLALSRRLAHALGGEVWLEQSTPGEGSTFVVEVKLNLVDRQRMFSALEPVRSGSPTAHSPQSLPNLTGVRILLVEDSYENQLLIRNYLESVGAHVDFANNGLQGVQMATANPYSLVLMDIQMPELDGYQATTQLRALGYTTPIIALTAHALSEERERCLSVGCNDHLTKPITQRDLVQRIAHFAIPHTPSRERTEITNGSLSAT